MTRRVVKHGVLEYDYLKNRSHLLATCHPVITSVVDENTLLHVHAP